MISSWGSWLVPVFSFESNSTDTPAALALSAKPWFPSVPSSHSRTTEVTSTIRNPERSWGAIGMPITASRPAPGAFAPVSSASVHALRAE